MMLCPLASGCLLGAAAWPSVSVTPVFNANAPTGQVRAFRVDMSTSHTLESSNQNEYVLSELSVSGDGWVAPQGKVGCDYMWVLLLPSDWKNHSVAVRLYRPGCQTIEVGSWNLPHEVKWTGVADLAGQEQAVDDLLETWRANMYTRMFMRHDREHDPPREPTPESLFGFVAAGSKSPEHRKALLFAASEYERLAKMAVEGPSSQAIRDRMMNKAAWLREQAEE
jgi:hypothetical protein